MVEFSVQFIPRMPKQRLLIYNFVFTNLFLVSIRKFVETEKNAQFRIELSTMQKRAQHVYVGLFS